MEADLEPQRVAGAEPAGYDAGVEQLGPDRRRHLGIDQQLDPVLAGVAGAADQRRAAADPLRRDPHPRRQLDPEGASDDAAGMRPLHSQHRVAIGNVTDADVEAAAPAPQPGQIGLVVGRVGDDQIAVATEPISEEVIEHPPLLVAKARVLSPTKPDRGNVIGEHPLQKSERPRPLNLNLAHMRNVEHPRMRPHSRVLLADPLVLTGMSQPAKGTILAPSSTCFS